VPRLTVGSRFVVVAAGTGGQCLAQGPTDATVAIDAVSQGSFLQPDDINVSLTYSGTNLYAAHVLLPKRWFGGATQPPDTFIGDGQPHSIVIAATSLPLSPSARRWTLQPDEQVEVYAVLYYTQPDDRNRPAVVAATAWRTLTPTA
jgi:hypothetical protein